MVVAGSHFASLPLTVWCVLDCVWSREPSAAVIAPVWRVAQISYFRKPPPFSGKDEFVFLPLSLQKLGEMK